MMKTLVIGMGIGQLYADIYKRKGWTVVTVDNSKPADFTDVNAVTDTDFDTAHVCTPNYLHKIHAEAAADRAKIVFVEKPGLLDALAWSMLINQNKKSRIVMVKNNQHRDEMSDLQALAANSTDIDLNWNNENRVPSPGSWFTERKRAWGGVSRDLMPHLLSIYIMLAGRDYEETPVETECFRKWTLEELVAAGTEYGTVNPEGVYDVDDHAALSFQIGDRNFHLNATWRNAKKDDRAIHFDDSSHLLGLCPESAYERMIDTAVGNLHNDDYWYDQLLQDMFIHRMMGKLNDAYSKTVKN
jgi:predicted dehydrogenase